MPLTLPSSPEADSTGAAVMDGAAPPEEHAGAEREAAPADPREAQLRARLRSEKAVYDARRKERDILHEALRLEAHADATSADRQERIRQLNAVIARVAAAETRVLAAAQEWSAAKDWPEMTAIESGAARDNPPRSRRARIADTLLSPLRGLRARFSAPRITLAAGPLGVSRSGTSPTSSARGQLPDIKPALPANKHPLASTDKPASITPSPLAAAPAAAAASKDAEFEAELMRLFATSADGSATAACDVASLARTLLEHPGADPSGRPGGHALRHEQALLIATTLRTLTGHPLMARKAYLALREHAPPLPAVLLPDSHKPAPGMARLDDEVGPQLGPRRMANNARRALASTAGGFQALLDLHGIALPSPGDPSRAYAEQAIEHYKLGLRAEDALIRLGLEPGKDYATQDVRDALNAHPLHPRMLDPSWLGTGNARRRPGGPHEAEHPMTLAAQAFLHATDNCGRAPGEPERWRDYKPAAVALRNGFTESGQGTPFHLMTKRLRKFITYIDLACKTPQGQLPTTRDRLRAPIRALRRLAGKDKTPLRTLLNAGPLASHLGTMPDHRADPRAGEKAAAAAAYQAAFDKALREMQAEFDSADPARRREILRQVMNSVVIGNDIATYRDGRRHGIGVTVGANAASIGGAGSLSFGITPVVELGADRSRAAVFKAGPSANSGVLFLGSERKVSGSVGAGVRVGTELGPVGLSAQAMARLGGSHLVAKGLMIRTNREGREHQALPPEERARLTASDWRGMGERVVNTIFEIADPTRKRPAHGGEMWARVVERLGDDHDISFGWNETRARSAEVSLSLEATARAELGLGIGAFATAGAGLKRTLLDKQRSRDTGGATRVGQDTSATHTSIGLDASAGITNPAVPLPTGQGLVLFGQHKVGVETDLLLSGSGSGTRITTQDGKVLPRFSFKERQVARPDKFLALMASRRAVWEPRLGPGVLDGFLQRIRDLPPAASNNRLFIEMLCLTPEAGERINASMERLAMLQRPLPPGVAQDRDTQDRIRDLQREIAIQVDDDASWEPSKLVVNETVSATRAYSLGAQALVTPATPPDPSGGGLVERFRAGGQVTLGAHVNSAIAGRDLLLLAAGPAPA